MNKYIIIAVIAATLLLSSCANENSDNKDSQKIESSVALSHESDVVVIGESIYTHIHPPIIGGMGAPTAFDYAEINTLKNNDPRILAIVSAVKQHKHKPYLNISMPNADGVAMAHKLTEIFKSAGIAKIRLNNAKLKNSTAVQYHLDRVMVMVVFR